MDKLLAQYLDKALDFENAGYVEEAIALLEKVQETFPEREGQILLEKAKLEFRNQMDRAALLDFIVVYERTKEEELYELILEAYHGQNKEMLEENYCNNLQYLENYPHYRGMCRDEKFGIIPIWQDEEILIYVDTGNRSFQLCYRKPKEAAKRQEKIVLAVNELWMEDIQTLEGNFSINSQILDMEIPLYLVFDRVYWELFLQLYDIKDLLKKNRIVCLVGEQALKGYFKEPMVMFPDWIFGDDFHGRYQLMLKQAMKEIEIQNEENIKKIEGYYAVSGDSILESIQKGKPRILFYTSHFTTAVQYHCRDCMQSAARLGCEVKMLKERDGIHRTFDGDLIQYIEGFKPDIIFCIDHFRFEYSVVPKEIIWVTWIQDPLRYIMDKDTPLKLTEKDFLINHFTTWKKFKEIGYEEKSLIDAPIPANHYIYKPYLLTEDEKIYECDICFVCHASDVDTHIAQIMKNTSKEFREIVFIVYKGYQQFVYETGTIFYTEEKFAEYIGGVWDRCYNFSIHPDILRVLVQDMCEVFNNKVFRQTLVDWILDAGFTNIKLWGNGWTTEEKYKKYAMGPAENGETLSKIYQASKIVLGNNMGSTAPARVWESMLSGAFYMCNYIPEEADWTDIRKILEVDKDVVMYYNQEDLIQKLHYYLEHEEERKKMAKRGREVALEKMTYDVLMQKVLNEVSKRFNKNTSEW